MAAAYGSDSPSGNFNAYDAITRAQNDMQRLLDSDTNGTDDADGTHQMSSFGVNGHTNGVGLVSQNGDRNGDASSSHSADTALNALSGDPATHCVMANFAYTSLDANQLSFAKGDIIQVFIEDPSGWWEGVLIKSDLPEYGCRGWFPHSELPQYCTSTQSHLTCLQTMHANCRSSPLARLSTDMRPWRLG